MDTSGSNAFAMFAVIAFTIALVCGVVSATIAGNRGLSGGAFFFAGFFLGVIGIVIAAVARPPLSAPMPPGWYPDPWRQASYRWYDGRQWTYHLG